MIPWNSKTIWPHLYNSGAGTGFVITSWFIAAWLGVLTSISPCPLATNIAAVSFLARRMHSRRLAVAGALAYASGRAAIYLVIGLLVTWGLATAPTLSTLLQQNVAPFIGPLLIVVGLVLLGWLSLPIQFGLSSSATAERLAGLGLLGEFLLGMVFALTFCPVSAALFFGTLLPLAVVGGAAWTLLLIYGVATAIPVGVIAVLLALGANLPRKILGGIQRWQGLVGKITGTAILLVGVWLTVRLFF